ncbi:MAG TPA: bifunctional pyr operon transcriptional regulator/uracil phosphoribosyltransferase PyrR [Candidatus Hydrogenedentes bacterium]|nr:bifunctional pyr operon transcriptional regulator/uracil phosphoribosyltransferase PyrR [Candidatus Hydrogenedentota bacterium]HOS01619.1 bifunctional pyr operon transcriptional regulator/uracil phosphoribosyltransferase PyrR [Candidatus Hydrogenedentota bacterium]
MSASENARLEITVVMDADAIGMAIRRIAQEIVADNPDVDSLALLGILSRGRPLADRIAGQIAGMVGQKPRVGSLATTLYRDDLRSGRMPSDMSGIASRATHFDFDVDGVTVVLVDDVLSTGRTVRAALDEVMDYGRPRRIQLAGLVDRGLRELPIQADYLGWSLATSPHDHVSVKLAETDGEDAVLLERRSPEATGGTD